MTEKRFTIKSQDDLFGITDNDTPDKMNVINGIWTEIEAKWLCDLMNELNDGNEKLKKQLELYGELYPSGKWIIELTSEELEKELEE